MTQNGVWAELGDGGVAYVTYNLVLTYSSNIKSTKT